MDCMLFTFFKKSSADVLLGVCGVASATTIDAQPQSLAGPGGTQRPLPPNGRGPMICLCPTR